MYIWQLRRFRVAVVLVLVAALFLGGLWVYRSQPNYLLEEAQIPANLRSQIAQQVKQAQEEGAVSTTFVDLNPGLLRSQEEVVLQVTKQEALHTEILTVTDTLSGTTYIGQTEGAQAPNVFLTEEAGQLVGSIDGVNGKSYSVMPSVDGLHEVRELDLQQQFADDLVLVPTGIPQTPFPQISSAVPSALTPDRVVDLRVYYTQAARNAAGSDNILGLEISNAVAQLNVALEQSGVIGYVNLVDVQLLSNSVVDEYESVGNLGSIMTMIQQDPNIQQTRAADRIDLIHVLTGGDSFTGVCGSAYTMADGFVGPQFSAFAVSVSKRSCMSNKSFLHEIGHNLGAEHNVEDSTSRNPASSDAYGYRECGQIRDVMSYACPGGGEPRIGRFSARDVPYNGRPFGNNQSNAAALLNTTIVIVAAFHEGYHPPQPTAVPVPTTPPPPTQVPTTSYTQLLPVMAK